MTNSFLFDFEEVPCIVENEWRAGYVNGRAEIVYYANGEWYVTALQIEHDNGLCGPLAKSKMISVSRTYQSALWSGLTYALENLHRDHIQDAVERALEDSELREAV